MALVLADALIDDLYRNGALLDNSLGPEDADPEERAEAIETLTQAGLIEEADGRWKLTDKGIRRGQAIAADEQS